MNFELVAIALGDVVWISLAFVFGFAARFVGLPPLVGFLATGFLLNSQGIIVGNTLDKLADIGITLLLFTVGLKLNLRTLIRPQVWGVAGLHMSLIVALFGMAIYALVLIGAPFVSDIDFKRALLIAFALSFSSTVFAVKVLEDKGEMSSLHGRIAIGVLIMQDIAAVVFLAISAGKMPSIWAPLILLLIPLRPMLLWILKSVGHGELLVLYGFMLALGGAEVFELVGLKGDLGALVIGVLIASHAKAEELVKTMLGFKDLFLLGFFLSIGMSGQLTVETVLIGVLIAPLVLIKSAFFFALFTGFRLRARTSLLASLNLTNFSEFGLIVIAIGVANAWISQDWLIVLAIALAVSFVIAAGLNKVDHQIYVKYRPFWRRTQKPQRLPDDCFVNINDATILIIGMGGIGTGAYDRMRDLEGDAVVGIDIDPVTVENQKEAGRNALLGDPSDSDFWDRVQTTDTVKLVMLALPKFSSNLEVLQQLKASSFTGEIAATAKFDDEAEDLKQAGATTVFNVYAEAGAGFASHVKTQHGSLVVDGG